RTLAPTPDHTKEHWAEAGQQTSKTSCKTPHPLVTAVPNILQNRASVHNLSRNTPAMPMVASAAKHKLSGFFMPGSFSA
ncbi:hypothetical protein QCD79_06675, partial [Pseudomonas quasicaspiana]|nr:hypothetical protein [Pseudomonas quasicaspiana]